MVDFFTGITQTRQPTQGYTPGVHTPLATKGDPGRPPTPEEVAAAVAAWIAANPLPPGPRGPGPTAEEVAASVSEWLTANPPVQQAEIDPALLEAAIQQYLADNPSAELTAHIGSPTPHPVYDEMEDLVLLFENRLI